MSYKFEKLQVWDLSLEYIDLIYEAAAKLPASERHNLGSQIIRAATSIALNIAEGSTSQSNPEQSRFVKMAIRSLVETAACLHLAKRRNYVTDGAFEQAYSFSEKRFAKLQAFHNSLRPCGPRSAVGAHSK